MKSTPLFSESKYASHFAAAKDTAADCFDLVGDALIVERALVQEIKTTSGIVIATADGLARDQANSIKANMPLWVHVLMIGAGYYDKEGNDVALDSKPGEIILVGAHSVKWLPVVEIDGYQSMEIGLCRESEIQWKFKSIEAYRKYVSALNSGSKAKMG